MNEDNWKNCIVCKNGIQFSSIYYKCSVSSCDKKRSPAQFCCVECWDVHRSIMSHKNAGADEYKAPSKQLWQEQQSTEPRVKIIRNHSKVTTHSQSTNEDDILIVASKLKSFVKESSGLNTSADVLNQLSVIVRDLSTKAILNARKDGRKTLMARDFQ